MSLKNKLFYLELRNNHEKKREKIIQELEDIRSNGGDADRADLLRYNLLRRDKAFKHLSAFYSKYSKGDFDTDK